MDKNSFVKLYQEHIEKSYKEMICDLEKTVVEKFPFLTFENSEYKTLPREVNFSIDFVSKIDFNKVVDEEYEKLFGNKYNGTELLIPIPEEMFVESYNSCKEKCAFAFYNYHNYCVYEILQKEQALEKFNKSVENIISRISNAEWSYDEYLYEIDNSPITININEQGRIELLDGYKRVLFNMNEKCMNLNVPVRVFRNLSDEKFLNMLFSLNKWKDNKNALFFDRGFLFAMKQRFGFEIPERTFFSKYNYPSGKEGLYVFNLYDFKYDTRYINQKENTSINEDFNFVTSMKHRSQFVNDMFVLHSDDFFNLVKENHGYDVDCYNKFIESTIIQNIGSIRRIDRTQKPLTIDVLRNIYKDAEIVKVCKKKVYSSDTYVSNCFFDKGVYKRIENILWDSITEEKELEMDETTCEDIRMAGYLHDIGKLQIDSKILNKNGTINDIERAEINKHVTKGVPLIIEADDCKTVYLEAITQHHAYYNNQEKGYYSATISNFTSPTNVAQIIAICDVYDALSNKRSYKEPFSKDKILSIMNGGLQEGQFNPEYFEVFVDKVIPNLEMLDEKQTDYILE